jgi:hypothetical protein
VTRARAEDYRRRAQECLDLARAISLERERAVLIEGGSTTELSATDAWHTAVVGDGRT